MTPPRPPQHPRPTLHPQGEALLWALAAGLTTYALTWAAGWPLVRYLPATSQWAAGPGTEPQAMSYYGLLLNGLLAFGLVYGVARLVSLRVSPSAPRVRRLTWLVGGITVAAMLLIAAVELARWGGAVALGEAG